MRQAYSFLLFIYVLCLGCFWSLNAQSISWEYLQSMPEAITNNAVTQATVNGEHYLYTFSGLDTSLECGGDHLRAYRYSVVNNSWDTIAALPDPMGGKIAAAANTISNKIYIVGGYHLNDSNCNEISSDRIHIFDPETNNYLEDGAPIPVPIDDQVQAVYRDSLLYVITGWSNTTNVRNVQIYDPATDSWQAGTPIVNSSTWRVFGGSGTIIGDTIYYAGGARNGTFTVSANLRKGYINPADPTDISWTAENNQEAIGYRMAAGNFEGAAIWIGGAHQTYNFDALSYSNSSVVSPLDRIAFYQPSTGRTSELYGFIPAIMDLRGLGELGQGVYLLAGGILDNQQVTDQLLKITIEELVSGIHQIPGGGQLSYFPNPSQDELQLQFDDVANLQYQWQLLDLNGQAVLSGSANTNSSLQLSIQSLAAGSYFLQLDWGQGKGSVIRLLKQ